jgi:hypothetical protein
VWSFGDHYDDEVHILIIRFTYVRDWSIISSVCVNYAEISRLEFFFFFGHGNLVLAHVFGILGFICGVEFFVLCRDVLEVFSNSQASGKPSENTRSCYGRTRSYNIRW